MKKLKKQISPGFEERNLFDKLDQSNFIRQSKDFYKSKGTEEAFKILFGALYGENVEMIQPSKYVIRPSDADYIVNDVLICELLSGDPLNITGQSLIQDTTPLETSGSIYNVECNAEEGHIIEIEREVDENDPTFKRGAKITIDQARDNVLAIHQQVYCTYFERDLLPISIL